MKRHSVRVSPKRPVFLYRGKEILSLNRGVPKSGSDYKTSPKSNPQVTIIMDHPYILTRYSYSFLALSSVSPLLLTIALFPSAHKKLKHPKEAILYSFLVDPKSPSHLKLSDKIFKADMETDIGYNTDTTMRTGTTYSDSNNTASQKVATELGVKSNYGAFSGSASMSVSNNCDKSIKTCRLDAFCVAGIASVVPIENFNNFNNFPHKYLTKAFKKSVKKHSFEEFSTRIGVFYATEITLGGRINKSYTMQASKEDNDASVEAELEASYGAGCWGVTGETKSKFTTRTSNEKSQMKSEWRAQGGKTTLWLGCSFGANSDAASVVKEWAASVEEKNAYPISMSLRPIWELVKKTPMGEIIRLLLELATIDKTDSITHLSESAVYSLRTLILSEQQGKELGRESERQGALLSPLREIISRAARWHVHSGRWQAFICNNILPAPKPHVKSRRALLSCSLSLTSCILIGCYLSHVRSHRLSLCNRTYHVTFHVTRCCDPGPRLTS
eukprot:sb/3464065/